MGEKSGPGGVTGGLEGQYLKTSQTHLNPSTHLPLPCLPNSPLSSSLHLYPTLPAPISWPTKNKLRPPFRAQRGRAGGGEEVRWWDGREKRCERLWGWGWPVKERKSGAEGGRERGRRSRSGWGERNREISRRRRFRGKFHKNCPSFFLY